MLQFTSKDDSRSRGEVLSSGSPLNESIQIISNHSKITQFYPNCIKKKERKLFWFWKAWWGLLSMNVARRCRCLQSTCVQCVLLCPWEHCISSSQIPAAKYVRNTKKRIWKYLQATIKGSRNCDTPSLRILSCNCFLKLLDGPWNNLFFRNSLSCVWCCSRQMTFITEEIVTAKIDSFWVKIVKRFQMVAMATISAAVR